MEQMVANGDTPWAMGIESGAASGWPATDWIEDIMLRIASPPKSMTNGSIMKFLGPTLS